MRPDLNLLYALEALLDEGSVVAAARRMHLSAPAMSRTLARIRETTGDPIFVQSGRQLVPTPRALELHQQIKGALQGAAGLLAPGSRWTWNCWTRASTCAPTTSSLASMRAACWTRCSRPCRAPRCASCRKRTTWTTMRCAAAAWTCSSAPPARLGTRSACSRCFPSGWWAWPARTIPVQGRDHAAPPGALGPYRRLAPGQDPGADRRRAGPPGPGPACGAGRAHRQQRAAGAARLRPDPAAAGTAGVAGLAHGHEDPRLRAAAGAGRRADHPGLASAPPDGAGASMAAPRDTRADRRRPGEAGPAPAR